MTKPRKTSDWEKVADEGVRTSINYLMSLVLEGEDDGDVVFNLSRKADKVGKDIMMHCRVACLLARHEAIRETLEAVETGTPRYIKGGTMRSQYYAKGYNDFRSDVLAELKKKEGIK